MAASLLLLGACGLFDSKAKFAQDLTKVDATIAEGDAPRALKRLKGMRKRAITASQWLSLAKRERALLAWDQASHTLGLARFKMPANDMVLAVLVDTLVQGGGTEEALKLSEFLLGSPYAIQAAAPRLLFSGEERDPRWWEIAAESTGDGAFRQNAAAWYAATGNLPAACAAAAIVAKDAIGFPGAAEDNRTARLRYMLALLYYDAGFPEQAIGALGLGPGTDTESRLRADWLGLLADASLERGNEGDAARFWEAMTASYPDFSPIPWYDLAVVAENVSRSDRYLESLLDRYPSYFPAVARYVSNYQNAAPPPPKDSLTEELESRGFYSLSMKDGASAGYPAREAVDSRLGAAIASTSGAPDIRLLIERAKVDERDSTDVTLSSTRIWNLLEKYSSNDLLVRYAMWFFLRTGQADTAFSLNRERAGDTDPFYDALEAAMNGDLDGAEASFNKCAASKEDSWAALANIARIREKKGDYASAVDYYDRATSFAPDDGSASDLQYAAALVLSREKDTRRAQQVLMRALELDPGNERAAAALRRLKGF